MVEEKVAEKVVIEKVDRLELENMELKLGGLTQQINALKAEGDRIFAEHQKLLASLEKKYGTKILGMRIMEDGTLVPAQMPPGMGMPPAPVGPKIKR